MALSNSQYESIMRVYNRTQLQKKHELDARVDEVYEKIPAVREMNDAIAAAAVKSAKELLAGDADAVKRLRGTDVYKRQPGKEGGDRASFQTLENQRERVLADAPVYENRVGYEVDKQHRANQHGEKPSIFGKYL